MRSIHLIKLTEASLTKQSITLTTANHLLAFVLIGAQISSYNQKLLFQHQGLKSLNRSQVKFTNQKLTCFKHLHATNKNS